MVREGCLASVEGTVAERGGAKRLKEWQGSVQGQAVVNAESLVGLPCVNSVLWLTMGSPGRR